MAKTYSSLKSKEQEHIKIFNFYIRKKTLYIVLGVILVLFIIIKYNQAQKQKELEQRMLAQSAIGIEDVQEQGTWLSLEEQIQMQLREKYGVPTEGFQWDYQGNLVPIASIEDMSAEDIVYTYLQSIHMMDFATAQRVAAKSSIITMVDDYYSEVSNALVTPKDTFNRRLIKLTLDKMTVDGITNTIVQADGTYIFTVDITCLDLSNKDFWRVDEQDIYQSMYVFDKTETDSTKKEQFIYDYIYDACKNDICGYKTSEVDIVVGKANAGGYLVTDDTTLRKLLLYEDGVGVDDYINLQYNEWVINQGYKGSGNFNQDVGFTHSDAAFDYEAEQQIQNNNSVENQQLQDELDYYEHGELPPKGYKKGETVPTTEPIDGESTVDDTGSSLLQGDSDEDKGDSDEDEGDSTAAQQEQAQKDSVDTDKHSQKPSEEAGYTKGN